MDNIICNKCGLTLSRDRFYKNRTSLGVERTCKSCREIRESAYRDKHREHRKEVQRTRWALKSAELNAKRRDSYRDNPLKDAARLKARRKVAELPCVVCGGKAERHHPDYSKPLEVVFLCRSHHRKVHNGTLTIP